MKRIGIFVFALFCILQAAEEPDIRTRVTPDQATVGDRLNVIYSITAPENYAILFSGPNEENFPYAIVDFNKKVKLRRDWRVEKYKLVLTAFDTGFVNIPSFPVVYGDSTGFGKHDTAYTSEKFIYISSILDSVQSASEVAPPEPLSLLQWWEYLVIVFLAALMIFFIFLAFRTNSRNSFSNELKNLWRCPEDYALEKIEELRKKDYPERSEWKEFYFQLTDIFKQYIENIHFIHIRELSTSESLPILKIYLEEEDYMMTSDCLKRADMVKFAKQSVNKSTCTRDLEKIEAFINKNKAENNEEGDTTC